MNFITLNTGGRNIPSPAGHARSVWRLFRTVGKALIQGGMVSGTLVRSFGSAFNSAQ
jgi:hypothetical protein